MGSHACPMPRTSHLARTGKRFAPTSMFAKSMAAASARSSPDQMRLRDVCADRRLCCAAPGPPITVCLTLTCTEDLFLGRPVHVPRRSRSLCSLTTRLLELDLCGPRAPYNFPPRARLYTPPPRHPASPPPPGRARGRTTTYPRQRLMYVYEASSSGIKLSMPILQR